MASEKWPFLTTRRGLLEAGVAAVMGGSTLAAGFSGKAAAQGGTPASHDDVYLSAAVRTARWIRSAQVAREVGIAWLPEPDHPDKRITQGPDNTLYSGSAGTVLFFLQLARATADSSYLEDARRGTDHLAASWEHLKDIYYLGYCHGPPGTARLFYQLHQVTGERGYLGWVEKLARGVMESGGAGLTPGYWNVACQCCGSAAEVEFFLSLWLATGKNDYRNFACRVADQLISRASDLDGKGDRWYQAWTRVKPWEVTAETGYKIGAAGIGAALIHAHLAGRDEYSAILFPDNPFPRSQQTREPHSWASE